MTDFYSRIVVAAGWRLWKLRELWNLQRLLWIDSRSLRRFEIGRGLICQAPIRIAGGQGEISIGDDVHMGHHGTVKTGNGGVLLQPRSAGSRIHIGSRTRFSNNVSLIACEEITVGEDCLIGDWVSITDADGHGLATDERRTHSGKPAAVKLSRNTWLGSRVVVLKGVEIGENSVVGAMSVVTRSIPPNSIAAGNPARVIRSI